MNDEKLDYLFGFNPRIEHLLATHEHEDHILSRGFLIVLKDVLYGDVSGNHVVSEYLQSGLCLLMRI